MAKKTITCKLLVSAESQVLKPDPASSDLGKPGVDGDSFNFSHRAYPSWIQQLEQGVADYESSYARAVTEASQPAKAEQSTEAIQSQYSDLKMQNDREVREAISYADELGRVRLDKQICASPRVLGSIEVSDQSQSDRLTFTAKSVERGIEPRISKSTYLPDSEKLDDGVSPPFEG
ncbi:hypothetical protein PENCOP_c009G00973 [Penicillium coprophilum]|uniref:Uncharacterized protein n=1 Tax=Penicillium coprophilum TaxID=36646 RepID=A0A1V6UGZ2_9EURO|nr:hypothetical protein PENCOP_c009G00973 [Penicillium coprophilum]